MCQIPWKVSIAPADHRQPELGRKCAHAAFLHREPGREWVEGFDAVRAISLLRTRESPQGAGRDRDPRWKEWVGDDRQPDGIVDRGDRIPEHQVGRHQPIESQSQEMALARRNLLTPHEHGTPAAEQVAQALEHVDHVVVRDDDYIESRGCKARDPIGGRRRYPERIACGVDVYVDAPDDIAHVRRTVVLTIGCRERDDIER